MGAANGLDATQQQLVDAENAALQQELLSMSRGVMQAERTMREISTLNQMFSTQVMHQSEQIEHLYSQVIWLGLTGSFACVLFFPLEKMSLMYMRVRRGIESLQRIQERFQHL
jgi:hypothetical protein